MKGELSENELRYKAEAYCSSMERCVTDVAVSYTHLDVYKRQFQLERIELAYICPCVTSFDEA